jgi:hypothetical protein
VNSADLKRFVEAMRKDPDFYPKEQKEFIAKKLKELPDQERAIVLQQEQPKKPGVTFIPKAEVKPAPLPRSMDSGPLGNLPAIIKEMRDRPENFGPEERQWLNNRLQRDDIKHLDDQQRYLLFNPQISKEKT